jgi:hypothetical protein
MKFGERGVSRTHALRAVTGNRLRTARPFPLWCLCSRPCATPINPSLSAELARGRRRGDRLATIAHSRSWHEAAVRKCPLLRRLWG